MLRRARKLLWALRHGRQPLRLIANRCAPSIEHAGVIRALAVDCVVDVGANVGQFASLVRALHPHVPVYAFEPLPAALKRLERVFVDDDLTTIFPYALSIAAGTAEMHISRRADSSSLLKIGDAQAREFSGTEEAALAEVQVRRLDDVLSPDMLGSRTLLKLDVQGAELRVLEGAQRLLPHFTWILSEVSFVELYMGQALAAELIRELAGWGFELDKVTMLSRGASGNVVQADVLFRRAH